MPANLNALIRYRTIDRCLSNPYRKWAIVDLMEACSKALEESRGIYTGISERTIREDIRVMRSDILGFNAPIVQQDGNYSYEDRAYSIFNVSIREGDLLKRVLEFMLEIRSEVRHPDMDKIIDRITEALPEITSDREAGPEYDDLKTDTSLPRTPAPLKKSADFGKALEAEDELFQEESLMKEPEEKFRLQWSMILNII